MSGAMGVTTAHMVPSSSSGGLELHDFDGGGGGGGGGGDGSGSGAGGYDHDRYGARPIPVADYHSPWEDTLPEDGETDELADASAKNGPGFGVGGAVASHGASRTIASAARQDTRGGANRKQGKEEEEAGGGVLKSINQRFVHLLTNPNVQFAWQF